MKNLRLKGKNISSPLFSYTTRLIYLGLCIFAKRNAHVDVGSFASANVQFSYCIEKVHFFFEIPALLTIFPYTTRLGFLGLSEQTGDMYFAVASETSPAKCLSYAFEIGPG